MATRHLFLQAGRAYVSPSRPATLCLHRLFDFQVFVGFFFYESIGTWMNLLTDLFCLARNASSCNLSLLSEYRDIKCTFNSGVDIWREPFAYMHIPLRFSTFICAWTKVCVCGGVAG